MNFDKSIYASEALFVYVIEAKALRKNYVPFVSQTEADSGISLMLAAGPTEWS